MGILLAQETVRSFIESENYVMIDENYVNSVAQMRLQCPKGHVFPMSWKVFRKGHRCSICAGKRQYNLDEVRSIFQEQGYALLSDEYLSNKDKLTVKAPDGSIHQTTLFAFKINKIIPHLKGSEERRFCAEIQCREFFEKATGKSFPKTKPEWLRNPSTNRCLELDGYCEELRLAFEYDGPQHFGHIYAPVEKTNERDLTKNQLCEKAGVRLIRVPHYISDKLSFVKNEIERPDTFMILGDPHVTHVNIDEIQNVIDFISKKMIEKGCNNLIILGDLFNTHGIIRLEVLSFWQQAVDSLTKQFRLHMLSGNHDMILGNSKYSGLTSVRYLTQKYDYNTNVALEPYVYRGIGFLSYVETEEEFINSAEKLISMGAKTLVCHQTFNGSRFDNGMFAPDGFDPDKVSFKTIISGHIHSKQRFGKVIYPGTSTWQNASDANQDKGVWLIDHDSTTGGINVEEYLSTANVVTPMRKITLKEGDVEPKLLEGSKYLIEMIGSSAWITKTRKKYLGRASLKSTCTDVKVRAKRDGKGFSSIGDFLDKEFQPTEGVDREKLVKYVSATA